MNWDKVIGEEEYWRRKGNGLKGLPFFIPITFFIQFHQISSHRQTPTNPPIHFHSEKPAIHRLAIAYQQITMAQHFMNTMDGE